MPKVKGPLFSLEAHGTLAGCLTYQDINAKPVVKSCRFKTPNRTEQQAAIRDTFSWAVSVWHALHQTTKQLWYDYKDTKSLVGYAAFMNTFLHRTYLMLWQFETPAQDGFCLVGDYTTGDLIAGGPYLESGSDPFP